ncbi:SBBP repeat-containing protein [Thermodesulfobacteriota bacterium]
MLGFAPGAMYIAAATHAAKVEFVGAGAAAPVAAQTRPASSGGQATELQQVTYPNLWHGISLEYEAHGGALAKSTYHVAPGTSHETIRLRYNVPVQVASNGNLVMGFATGTLSESRPVAWQDAGSTRIPVEAAFEVRTDGTVGFSVGAYNPALPLVIDPVLSWHTFVGGSGADNVYGIALDDSGNIYISGHGTAAWDNETHGNPVNDFVPSGGNCDVFVAKLNSSLALQWYTFLGGPSDDRSYYKGIGLDNAGNIYIAGSSKAQWTTADGDPLDPAPLKSYSGMYDAYVAKLDNDGNLLWHTFLGSVEDDYGFGISVSESTPPHIYISGYSENNWDSQKFDNPVNAHAGADVYKYDGFAAMLDGNGAVEWHTFLGAQNYEDVFYDVDVDNQGNVYLGGWSQVGWGSPQNAYYTNGDALIAKLNAGGHYLWHTFYGGDGSDACYGITVDANGKVYATGFSTADWEMDAGIYPVDAFADTPGGADGFAVKIDTTGKYLWHTFIGSANDDYANSITVDTSGGIYISGNGCAAWSAPTTFNAYSGGLEDAFLLKLNPDGARIWNTFMGSSSATEIDVGNTLVLDSNRRIYLGGYSGADWGSAGNYTEGKDGFVAVFNPETALAVDIEPAEAVTAVAQWRINGGSWYDSGTTIESVTATDYTVTFSTVPGYTTPSPQPVTVTDDSTAVVTGTYAPVIDPANWHTFLGGNADDYGQSVAVDENGNKYIAGTSTSAWDTSKYGAPLNGFAGGGCDAYVAKTDSAGNLIWYTFLGGESNDWIYRNSLGVDDNGNVYAAGYSTGVWADTLPPPLKAFSGIQDAFVAKLNSSGQLQWHTFLGGSQDDVGLGIAVKTVAGNTCLFVAGTSYDSWDSAKFGTPVIDHAPPSEGVPNWDAFAAKLDDSGTLAWYTFLGGPDAGPGLGLGLDQAYGGIDADESGNVYVAGNSSSSWGNPENAFINPGAPDTFVAKLNCSGHLLWNTFMGGSGHDYASGIAVDKNGNTYVSGYSNYAWGSTAYNGGDNDGFVAKLDSTGKRLWDSLLGGTDADAVLSIAVDSSGNAYASGHCLTSWGTPLPGFEFNGGTDAFAVKYDTNGTRLWNVFVGSSLSPAATFFDSSSGIAVDGKRKTHLFGTSNATWGTPLQGYNGGLDAFLAVISPEASLAVDIEPAEAVTAGAQWSVDGGSTWYASGHTLEGITPGEYTVTFDTATGYSTPADQTVTVTSDNTTVVTGTYAPIIDPANWHTFLGGNADEYGSNIAIDESGNKYIAGTSTSAWDTAKYGTPLNDFAGGACDAYVAKVDSTGSLLWYTFLGGASGDLIYRHCLGVDDSGNVYVAGYSTGGWADSFPPPLKGYSGSYDAFVAKLNADGQLQWYTFLGGSLDDWVRGIAVKAIAGNVNVYISGASYEAWDSGKFSNPLNSHSGGVDNLDVFAAKLGEDGSLLWYTFMGSASALDRCYTIAADSDGNAYLGGFSNTTWGNPIIAHTEYGSDAFAVKLNSGGHMLWNTFLGGTGDDIASCIAIDKQGNAYISGYSSAVWGSTAYNGGDNDGFIAKLDSTGQLVWDRLFGGAGNDAPYDLTVASSGNAYVGGTSESWGTPLPGFEFKGGYDAFAVKYDTNGNRLWHAFMGGSLSESNYYFDSAYGITVDGNRKIVISGTSGTTDATWGVPLQSYNAGIDAFLAVMSPESSLAVDIEPAEAVAAGAQWSIDGGATWHESGETVDATPGEYTISFTTGITGWDTPSNQTVTVTSDNTTVVTGTYTATAAPDSWNTFLGGSGQDETGGIARDGSGNIYVVGNSDSSWGNPVRPFEGGAFDIYVAKYDSSGNLLWNTFLGGPGEDNTVRHCIAFSDGNVYIAGRSDSAWGSSPANDYTGLYDGFAAKLDADSGSLVWNTFIGENGSDDYVMSLAVDASSNVYFTGRATTSLGTWGSTAIEPYTGAADTFVAKLDTNGNRGWHTFIGGNYDDAAYGIAVTPDGSKVYVGGYQSTDAGGNADAFAARIDAASGSRDWITFMGGNSNFNIIGGLETDAQGNVFAAGYSYAAWTPASTVINPYQGGVVNAFVARLDSNGVLQWHTFMGGTDSNNGDHVTSLNHIGLDTSGKIYAAGYSRCTWGTPREALTPHPEGGKNDVLVAKLNENGTALWHTFIGTINNDYSHNIAVDAIGTVYVAGTSAGTWGTPIRPYSYGISDGFIKLLPADGTISVAIEPEGAIDEGARWRIDGGAWQTSGTALADVEAGSHTVSFETLTGYTTPADSAANVLSAQTVYVTGTYLIQPRTLTINNTGTGSGTVTSSPAGISCGSDCEESYDYKTGITLSAQALAGSYFEGWSGGTCSGIADCAFTLAENLNVTAQFESCSFSTPVPASGSHPAGAGTYGFSMDTAAGSCYWTAATAEGWINISDTEGFGPADVDYTVDANEGPARSGSIILPGHTYTVQQASGCSATLNGTSSSHSGASGSYSVAFTTSGTGCAWTASSSSPSWLTVTIPSGIGSGSIGYTVTQNNGASRSATITLSGGDLTSNRTFTVNQENRYSEDEPGTVTDVLTGLMWLKDANSYGDEMSWAESIDYINSFNDTPGGTYGYDNWRLPTRNELAGLLSPDHTAPALAPGHPFENVVSANYWTATTWSSDTTKAFAVSLFNRTSLTSRKSTTKYAWPVRSVDNSTSPTLMIEKTGGGTVTSQNLPADNYMELYCGGMCFTAFSGGSTIVLEADPVEADGFNGWDGCDSVSDNGTLCTVVMDNDTIVSADFDISSGSSDNSTVTEREPHNDKAIIVAAGSPLDWLWNATEYLTIEKAYQALRIQGFEDEAIYYLTHDVEANADGDAEFEFDDLPTGENLQYAITEWAQDADNVVIYLCDHGGYEFFYLNLYPRQKLSAVDLGTWIDALQEAIPGYVAVVYEACYSGSFLPHLTPLPGLERVVITSAGSNELAVVANNGRLTFSSYFWTEVLLGNNVWEAFKLAKQNMEFLKFQHPLLDADGDGISQNGDDISNAEQIKIGFGDGSLGVPPIIDSIVGTQYLYGSDNATELWVDEVDYQGTYIVVYTDIYRPDNSTQYDNNPVNPLATLEMVPVPNTLSKHNTVYAGFRKPGIYEISAYAQDDNNALSVPKTTRVVKDFDLYEEDNAPGEASFITVGGSGQFHNLRDQNDEDWLFFYAMPGMHYKILVDKQGSRCNAVIELYGVDGTTLLVQRNDESDPAVAESLDWTCDTAGIYYVRITQHDQSAFGSETYYTVRALNINAPVLGLIEGGIIDTSGIPVHGAIIKTDGGYAACSINGSYIIPHCEGPAWSLQVEAEGYLSYTHPAPIEVTEGESIEINIVLQALVTTTTTSVLTPETTTTTTAGSNPKPPPGGGGGGGGGTVTETTTSVPPVANTTTTIPAGASTSTTTTAAEGPAPVTIFSIPSEQCTVGESYLYNIEISGCDAELSFELLTGPEGMSILADKGVITWTPSRSQIGSHTVAIQATCGDLPAAEQTFTINVTPGTCPIAEVLGDRPGDLARIRAFRDRKLAAGKPGAALIYLYYFYGSEITDLLNSHPGLRQATRNLIFELLPAINAGESPGLTGRQRRALAQYVELLSRNASPGLHNALKIGLKIINSSFTLRR